jgi:protein pelota
MKIIKKAFSKDGAGTIVLLPQDTEDMWHVYNLVRPGDRLKAVTYRKVQVRYQYLD